MDSKLPKLIVTGASGIVGRGLLEAAKEDFLIYAIARRSQKEAKVNPHPNIQWIQVDIGNWLSVRWVMHNIKRKGGADFVIHLAGYYDFEYKPHPEYQRTNINGTRYMLEQSKILQVKRFIYASSSAASEFPSKGNKINEKSDLDGKYDYARSKKKGEEMVKEFSQWFPCSIVRFAAVYTDWCEYGPLYMFLSAWLSKSWKSRILGGKGLSAVPYIHGNDLNNLMLIILNKTKTLPDFDIYLGSPDDCVTHLELFNKATRYFYGKHIKPFFMPKFLALPGVILSDLIGRIIGNRPFERPWMMKYIDLQLDIDPSYTSNTLGWKPTPRYHILRRLLFLIEKIKSDPNEWHFRNTEAMKRVSIRPGLQIYDVLMDKKDLVIADIESRLLMNSDGKEFANYQKKNLKDLKWDISIFYQLIASSVRLNDRIFLLDYIHDLAQVRSKEGFTSHEVASAVLEVGKIILLHLMKEPELNDIEQLGHDYITLTIQLAVDEIEDTFEKLDPSAKISDSYKDAIEEKIRELETFQGSHSKQ